MDALISWLLRNVGQRYIVGGIVAIFLFVGYEQYAMNAEQDKAIHELQKQEGITVQIQKDIKKIEQRQEKNVEKLDRKLDRLIDHLLKKSTEEMIDENSGT